MNVYSKIITLDIHMDAFYVTTVHYDLSFTYEDVILQNVLSKSLFHGSWIVLTFMRSFIVAFLQLVFYYTGLNGMW